MLSDKIEFISGLSCWQGPVQAQPLSGGITNHNFKVSDQNGSYVVRIGEDIPEHQVMRFNELAASQAAHAAGLSPAVLHSEPGVLVLDFIEGQTLDETAVCESAMLERLLPVIKDCHGEIPKHFRGPVLMFWVFHVLRNYQALVEQGKGRRRADLPKLMATAERLAQVVGPVDLVFGHNDLLAANFIDDGKKIWLIDWDYAGFNSSLFDLGGLASNNGLDESQERWLLENYFEQLVSTELWRSYGAMKCASLLREAMWSMVSEIHSLIDFDYETYTDENLDRFIAAVSDFDQL